MYSLNVGSARLGNNMTRQTKTMKSFTSVSAILFFVLITFSSLAQRGAQGPQRAFQYHSLTNKAELAICEGKIALAHSYYTNAFQINPNKPFSIDLLNAFKCAMDLNNKTVAESHLRKLMSRGFNEQMSNSLYQFYKKDDSIFIHKTLHKYPNLVWKLEHEINVQAAEMMVSDQGIRMQELSTRPMGNYMTDTVYAVDLANAETLRRLFEKYGGIPNEDVIGNYFGWPSFTELMHHHKGGGMANGPSHFFDTMLISALSTFDISTAFVAKFFSKGDTQVYLPWSPGIYLNMPVSLFYGHYKNKYDSQFFDREQENKMNAERAKIGLCSLDDMRKKEDYIIAHRKKGKPTKYNMESSVIGYLETDNAQEYEQWRKREVYSNKK